MPTSDASSSNPPGTTGIIHLRGARSSSVNGGTRRRHPARVDGQHPLHRRYRRLAARGKPKQLIVTAVARELTGFLRAVLTQ